MREWSEEGGDKSRLLLNASYTAETMRKRPNGTFNLLGRFLVLGSSLYGALLVAWDD